jgi:hypothetical protein
MSSSTMPHHATDNGVADIRTRNEAVDPRTGEGLRDALRSVQWSGSWETPEGQRLLAEVRRRAVRNAAHVASATGAVIDRGLVDDVLWRHGWYCADTATRCSLPRARGRT